MQTSASKTCSPSKYLAGRAARSGEGPNVVIIYTSYNLIRQQNFAIAGSSQRLSFQDLGILDDTPAALDGLTSDVGGSVTFVLLGQKMGGSVEQ